MKFFPPLFYFLKFLELAPVLAFVWAGRLALPEAQQFYIAGGSALALVTVLWALKWRFNPLSLGANLFLMTVALNYLLAVPYLTPALAYLRESGWFVALLLVGGAYTLCSPRGYVGFDEAEDPAKVRRSSCWLLIATLGGLALSHLYRGDIQISAVLPITGLFLLQHYLKGRLQNVSSAQGLLFFAGLERD